MATLALVRSSPAQQVRPAAPARADGAPAVVEVVPTSRRQVVEWRYTLEKPANDWAAPAFDDGGWKPGRSPFGTAGTPGIAVNTPWSTPDIWLRREAAVPVSGVDLSAVQLFVFHDEDVEIYFDGVLAARQTGFIRDYEPVEILPDARKRLKSGASIVLAVHCRQTAGGQGVDVGLATVPQQFLADVESGSSATSRSLTPAMPRTGASCSWRNSASAAAVATRLTAPPAARGRT
jgi:hypothetical protein